MNIIKKIIEYPISQKFSTLVFRKPRLKKCGGKTLICKPIKMSYNKISIGDYVYIWPNCRIEAVTTYEGINYSPQIHIGNYVSIQQNLHLTCAESIKIGNYTAIAANVTITDINHQYQNIHIPPEKQPLDVSPVEIGESCKIYNNAVILPGTTIGRHCVIGANSVVNGIFDDYCVIAGIPAKIIKKYNFELTRWERINLKPLQNNG